MKNWKIVGKTGNLKIACFPTFNNRQGHKIDRDSSLSHLNEEKILKSHEVFQTYFLSLVHDDPILKHKTVHTEEFKILNKFLISKSEDQWFQHCVFTLNTIYLMFETFNLQLHFFHISSINANKMQLTRVNCYEQ